MNKLTVISHPAFGEVRSMTIKGEPWFVAKDVCEVLGLTNVTESLKRLDEDEKTESSVTNLSSVLLKTAQNYDMIIINESGMYNLIFQSRKPEARIFRKWVTSEVLPNIRKHGYYINPKAEVSPAELRRLHKENLKLLKRWITRKDIYDCYQKLRIPEEYIERVLRGDSTNNEIMNDLHTRAIKNRNNYVDAYSQKRIREVNNILAR